VVHRVKEKIGQIRKRVGYLHQSIGKNEKITKNLEFRKVTAQDGSQYVGIREKTQQNYESQTWNRF